MNTKQIDAGIFKAYDIRGIVDVTLNKDTAELIGRAIATIALSKGVDQIAIGRDGRLSGPILAASLIQGITACGINVIDIGMVATPMLYFAAVENCHLLRKIIPVLHSPEHDINRRHRLQPHRFRHQ